MLLRLFFVSLLCLSISFVHAQDLWTDKSETPNHLHAPEHENMPNQFRYLAVNRTVLQERLLTENACLDIAMPDGSEECFVLTPTQIVHPKTALQRPDLKTYRGKSLENPLYRIHVVVAENDFHVIGEGSEGVFFIDQVKNGEGEAVFISFWGKDDVIPDFQCNLIENPEENTQEATVQRMAATSWGTELRTFRAAIMWTNGHVATYNNDTTAIINRNVEIINDMNFVLERDVCVTFELAINPELLIYPDPATDPYNGLGSATGIINGEIGSTNYEIGHVINGGGGGVSYVGVTCGGSKAGTQSSNSHWVIVHEWGHNMGSGHTFNHCPGWGSNGIEPGAGNSIMSYGATGVCSTGHQVPGGRINYFHSFSVQKIYEKLFLNTTCSSNTATNNTAPTITMPASGFSIPKSTPFTLTGVATDAEDASNLTYSWEQYQWGVGTNPNAPTANDPLFRMYDFSNSPTRTFPRIDEIINGYNYGEVLPEVSRTLDFRLSVRDNHTGGSGITYDNMNFLVEETAGPFVVTFPNEAMIFGSVGQTRTITWDVANTDIAPVSCANVNILLSTDGGYTYPITVATSVPNTGSAAITIPDAVGTTNRIRIEAADNIFFDISDKNFEIVAADTNDFSVTLNPINRSICAETSIDYQLDLYALGVFASTVDLTWTGLPTGAILSMPSTVNGTSLTTITLSNLDAVATGFHPMVLDLIETGGGVNKTINLELTKKENTITLSPDQAMSFDGSSWVHIPKTTSDFNFGDDRDFSIELWTKTTTTSGDDALIADKNWDSGNNKGWVIFMQSGKIGFNAGEDGANNRVDISTGSTTFNDGEWHHIAVSFTRAGNGLVQLYVDGVFYSQAEMGHLGSIYSEYDLVIGADKDNDYAYEGEIYEVRIWSMALTATEIRESMHRVWELCATDLISCWQFNEASGDVLDAFSHHDGVVTNATRVASTAPFGTGVANTQTETTGLVSFSNTNLDIAYTKHDNAEVVVTKINLAPFGTGGIDAGDVLLNQQYWVFNRFAQNGDLLFNPTFTVGESITASEATNFIGFKLYGRNANAHGDWTLLANATAADEINQTIAFEQIAQYGQYLISKTTSPTIALSPLSDAFCPTAVNGLSRNRVNYILQGAYLTSDIILTPPAGFEISLTENTGFSANPISLSPTANSIPPTPIYIRFAPSNIGVQTGTISHTTTGYSQDLELTAEAFPASALLEETAGTAMTFDGDGDIVDLGNTSILSFEGNKNYSFEIWVNPHVNNASGHFISKYNRFIVGQYFFGMENGVVELQREVPPYSLLGTTQLQAGEWYHVVGTYDGTDMKIYINGELDASQVSTGSIGSSNTNVTIGGGFYNNSYGYFIEAELDELRVWNRALTQEEIRANRHLILSTCESDLLANFQFNEASGAVTCPISGLTGTLHGDVARVTASEPIGRGYSFVQGETMGETPFDYTACSIDFAATSTSQAVVSKIENAPYNTISITGQDELLEAQYWILNRYGVDSFLGNLTFQPNEIVNNNPNEYTLFGRAANEFDTWTLIGTASQTDLTDNSIRFENVATYGQYLIGRTILCAHTETYSETISSGVYQTSSQIISTGLIPSTESVEFKSDCIKLESGFEVELGGELLVVPEPCLE